MPLTDPMPPNGSIRDALRALQVRSGMTPAELLRRRTNKPKGLFPQTIEAWLSGAATHAPQEQLEYVLRIWSDPIPIVRVTERLRRELAAQKRRTGVGASRLLLSEPNAPEGLTPGMVDSFLEHRARSVRQDHLDFLLAAWSRLPDRSGPARKRKSARIGQDWSAPGEPMRIPIPSDTLKELRNERERTGVGPEKLLADRTDIPHGLTASKVSCWLSRRTATARADFLEYALDCWKSLPDKH